MGSSRTGTSRRTDGRRLALWTALSVGWLLPSAGCQVEYAGMTLPSGKYMHDDVQYFAPGPNFPFANTQAATQRARMQAQGIDPGAPLPTGLLPNVTPPGALPAVQGRLGRFQDINQGSINNEPPLGPSGVPGATVPAPNNAAPGLPGPGAPGTPAPPPPGEGGPAGVDLGPK